MRRPIRTRFSGVVCSPLILGSLIVIPPSAVAGQDSACDPPFPAPTLCQRANLDSIQANFILIVDESGSMMFNRLWEAVPGALEALAQAVPESDQLRLLFFAGSTREHGQPWGTTPQEREAWRLSVRSLPRATGLHTDLGRAMDRALDIISGEPPDRQQFVILVTDGMQDPEAGSAFRDDPTAPAWVTLRERAEALARSRPVSFTLVRIADEADDRLLHATIPGLQTIDAVGPSAFRNWFERYTRDFQVAKLRLAVDRDRSGVSVDFHVGSEAEPRVAFGRETEVAVTAESRGNILEVRYRDPVVVDLPHGATLTVREVRVAPEGPTHGAIRITDRSVNLLMPPGWATRTFDVVATGMVELEPADELERIGIPAGAVDSVRVRGAYSAGGWTASWPAYAASALALLALLAGLLRWVKWNLHRPRLDGFALATSGRGSNGNSEVVPLTGKRFIVKAPDGTALFHLVALNVRGSTRLGIDRGGAGPDIRFDRKVDEHNLRTGTTITATTDAGDLAFTIMRRG